MGPTAKRVRAGLVPTLNRNGLILLAPLVIAAGVYRKKRRQERINAFRTFANRSQVRTSDQLLYGTVRAGEIAMKSILYTALVLIGFSSTASGEDQVLQATEIVQKAERECAAFEGGTFKATERAITLHDFTGDGRPEEVVVYVVKVDRTIGRSC